MNGLNGSSDHDHDDDNGDDEDDNSSTPVLSNGHSLSPSVV